MRNLRKTTESFIKDSNIKHNNFYIYDKVIYKGCCTKVEIVCPIHGSFNQNPSEHLWGKGCIKCGHEISKKAVLSNTNDFIKKANKIHNNYYQYNKVNYTGAKNFVTITCPIHGDFQQRPNYHLSKNGCTKCANESSGFGRSSFIKKCKNNQGLLYLVRFYNEKESFYKIGITGSSIKYRFRRIKYEYEIIYQKIDTPENIFNLEKTLHKKYRNLKYVPLNEFKGYTECFLLNKNIINNDFRRDESSTRAGEERVI